MERVSRRDDAGDVMDVRGDERTFATGQSVEAADPAAQAGRRAMRTHRMSMAGMDMSGMDTPTTDGSGGGYPAYITTLNWV